MIVKCLPVDIYTSKDGVNCSNKGISTRFNQVLLIHDEGFISVDMDNPPENLCKAVEMRFPFGVYTHVEPVKKPDGLGWMNGGCIVYTPDSRFGYTPLMLFDRQETQEEYDRLSS